MAPASSHRPRSSSCLLPPSSPRRRAPWPPSPDVGALTASFLLAPELPLASFPNFLRNLLTPPPTSAGAAAPHHPSHTRHRRTDSPPPRHRNPRRVPPCPGTWTRPLPTHSRRIQEPRCRRRTNPTSPALPPASDATQQCLHERDPPAQLLRPPPANSPRCQAPPPSPPRAQPPPPPTALRRRIQAPPVKSRCQVSRRRQISSGRASPTLPPGSCTMEGATSRLMMKGGSSKMVMALLSTLLPSNASSGRGRRRPSDPAATAPVATGSSPPSFPIDCRAPKSSPGTRSSHALQSTWACHARAEHELSPPEPLHAVCQRVAVSGSTAVQSARPGRAVLSATLDQSGVRAVRPAGTCS